MTGNAKDRVRIPDPVEGGGYDVEGLGPLASRPIGGSQRSSAAMAIRAAGPQTEPAEEADDVSIEVPAPVPGGNESITRGDPPGGRAEDPAVEGEFEKR